MALFHQIVKQKFRIFIEGCTKCDNSSFGFSFEMNGPQKLKVGHAMLPHPPFRDSLLARDVMYTSRAYAMMPVSVCL